MKPVHACHSLNESIPFLFYLYRINLGHAHTLKIGRLESSRMKKLNLILRKCKTLSRQLGRTSSYSSLRSKSARDHQADRVWGSAHMQDDHEKRDASTSHEDCETAVFVGSSRRRFLVKSKYLNHPLLRAIIQKSNKNPAGEDLSVKCEVVLFDHLLWMLDNADPNLTSDTFSLEELADLYVF